MTKFLNQDFLLSSKTARMLFHEYASHLPIIDYHCHLPPQQMADNLNFENLTQAWLYGDHYKWRAMRTNGVAERFCTGDAPDFEKFEQWACTVPYTLRNPLYHWTHLELQRYFDIHEVLNKQSAAAIYEQASASLRQPSYSIQNLLRKMNVALVCTTDDPADSLEHHQALATQAFEIPVLPAFRPDAAMNVANPVAFNHYIHKLEAAGNCTITTLQQYLDALLKRHDYFHSMGCRVSDHGLEQVYAADFTETEVALIFDKLRQGHTVTPAEELVFKSAMLYWFAEWDHAKGWVQQYHLGALRNNNSRMMRLLGPDTGWDSIGDFTQGKALATFLNRLDEQDKLAKTILYNLNPADNELMATMIGNFNDGSVAGKVQWGSAWWFLDQKDGMTKQINALSNMGLLSRFVGMLKESRSFLSFPRHEYFRRILCNLFGTEVEAGELPNDLPWIGSVISDICYYNARSYFGWEAITPQQSMAPQSKPLLQVA